MTEAEIIQFQMPPCWMLNHQIWGGSNRLLQWEVLVVIHTTGISMLQPTMVMQHLSLQPRGTRAMSEDLHQWACRCIILHTCRLQAVPKCTTKAGYHTRVPCLHISRDSFVWNNNTSKRLIGHFHCKLLLTLVCGLVVFGFLCKLSAFCNRVVSSVIIGSHLKLLWKTLIIQKFDLALFVFTQKWSTCIVVLFYCVLTLEACLSD